jgi:hypothetical protein
MLLNDIILETPALIPDIDDTYLSDIHQNQARLHQLARYPMDHVYTINENFAVMLVYEPNGEEVYIGVDHKELKIVYYMMYEVNHDPLVGRYVSQAMVWLDKSYAPARGLPKKIFFDQLVKKYDTILTDSIQTWNGRAFWMRRLQEAFQKGFNVYYVNLDNDSIEKLEEFADIPRFDAKYHIWDAHSFHKRLAISKKKLMK